MSEPTTGGAITSGSRGYTGNSSQPENKHSYTTGGSNSNTIDLNQYLDINLEEYEGTPDGTIHSITITDKDGNIVDRNLEDWIGYDAPQTLEEALAKAKENPQGLIFCGACHDPNDGFNPNWKEDLVEDFKETGATVVVGTTTLFSSVLKLGEDISDGATWFGGTLLAGGARVFGANDFANQVENDVMNHIATDQVGILNDEIYGEGKALSGVNDASILKYNSPTAKTIQNAGEKGVVIVGATAATVATGGAATPLLVVAAGGLAAGGNSAETHFQDTEKRDYWSDSIDIGIDTVVGAVETYGYGQSGSSLVKGFRTIRSIGLDGAKDLARRTVNNFGSSTYRRIFTKGVGTAFKQAGVQTLKNPSTWLETCAVISPEIKKGIKTGEWDWETMAAKTGGVLGSNYMSALGSEIMGLSNKAGRVAEAETAATEAFKSDSWIAANVSEPEFAAKVAAAEARAIEMDEAGILSEEKFYEVWGADPGTKPDPSTYLPKDYIDKHLDQFSGGASRVSSTDDYMKFVGNTTGTVGNPTPYNMPGSGSYTGGSEFMSVKGDIDNILSTANSSSNPYGSLATDLGMQNPEKFNSGVWRYDIDGSELGGLNLRMPSGNEPGAYKMDWLPGGLTSGGAPEAVVDMFTGNGSTIKIQNVMGAKPVIK